MYNCSVCSFSSIRRRAWDRHYLRFGHALKQDDADMASLHDSFDGETPANPPGDSCEESQPDDPSPEEISSVNDLIDASPPHNDSEPDELIKDDDDTRKDVSDFLELETREDSEDEQEEGSLVCTVCFAKFKTRSGWKNHKVIHQKFRTKEFSCHVCFRRFYWDKARRIRRREMQNSGIVRIHKFLYE